MLAATALVLLMTPALGLFYAGLVREKNTLNTFMMSIAAIAVALVTWALVGYSLAFDDTDNNLIGGLSNVFLKDVGFAPRDGSTIPHLLFFAFQATFCIITTALVSGAIVERMRFVPFLIFSALWSVLVYAVLAHWAFGGGWLITGGTLDFAGGVPVEMGSGFSALAAAIVVGARKDYGRQALLPHNAVYCLLGAGLLWFGWFGFNGGSGFNTGSSSVLAFVNTLLCPACTLGTWIILDLIRGRQATAIGAATAIIVGCVRHHARGWLHQPDVGDGARRRRRAAELLPSSSGARARASTRRSTCSPLTAWPASRASCSSASSPRSRGTASRTVCSTATRVSSSTRCSPPSPRPAYAFVVTYGLLKLIGLFSPLRATEHEESIGLDIIAHGEEAYASGEGAILVVEEPRPRRRRTSELGSPPDGELPRARAITVAAPPRSCFDALTDYERLTDWQGALKAVRVLERFEGGAVVEYEIDAKVRTVSYTLRLEHDPPHRIGSTFVEGDFRSLEAEWRFGETADGGTDVELELTLDPGRFVPGPIRSVVRSVVMGRTLADLARHVDG